MKENRNNTAYDYRREMYADVQEYIERNINFCDYADRDELEEYLNEELWTEDSVTGKASGSYTFSTYQAEEYLCHNFDLLIEALMEFGQYDYKTDYFCYKGAEWADVTIRCYLLSEVIANVLDDFGEMPYGTAPDEIDFGGDENE